MTKEMIHNTANDIIRQFMWLTVEEEAKVMAIVKQELWLRRERESIKGA